MTRRYPPKPGAAKRQLEAMDAWFKPKDSTEAPIKNRPRPRPKTAIIAEAVQRKAAKAVDSRETWTELERLAYEVQTEHGKGRK